MEARRSQRRFFFWSQDALFGRYWGAAADYNSLHFENLLPPGALSSVSSTASRASSRAPRVSTKSAGVSSRPSPGRRTTFPTGSFRNAIEEYLEREGQAVDAYAEEIQGHVPYRGQTDTLQR